MKEKGLGELMEAWKKLRGKSQLRLLVAGPVDERNPPDATIIRNLKTDPKVHIHTDWINHEEMPRWYAVSDIVVVPTWREGLGMAILEAGAMEKPVVASDVPGCRCAVIDGVTGALVTPRNAGSIIHAVERYISDSELRTRHGKAARGVVVNNFRASPVRDAVISIYGELLKKQVKKIH